jgi:hypothetical protein
MIGPLTVSRIIEAILLLFLGGCGLWFLGNAKDAAAQ